MKHTQKSFISNGQMIRKLAGFLWVLTFYIQGNSSFGEPFSYAIVPREELNIEGGSQSQHIVTFPTVLPRFAPTPEAWGPVDLAKASVWAAQNGGMTCFMGGLVFC